MRLSLLLQPARYAPFVQCTRRRATGTARMSPLNGTGPLTDAPEGFEYVFSYGSNSTAQLTKRLKRGPDDPFVVHPASLRDHVRIFAGHAVTWGGAVASVHPCPDQEVQGLVVQMTNKEMEVLDTFEGSYTRVIQTFHACGTGKPIRSWVYVKNDTTFQGPPSQSYLLAIHRMLSEGGHNTDIGVWYLAAAGHIACHGRWSLSTGYVEQQDAGTTVAL